MRGISRVLALAAVLSAALATTAIASAAGAGGVTGEAFYVNGETYRTVGTPTDLSGTGAPDHSFQTIFNLGGAQLNVATAAPGDPGYRGGRWMVHAISFNTDYGATLAAHDLNGNGVFDYAAEIESALTDGSGTGATDLGVVKQFVCPVIKLK